MRTRFVAPVFLFSLAAIEAVYAQPARLGRLPALAALRPNTADCRPTPVNVALRRNGVASATMVRDTAGKRMITLGLSARGEPLHLLVMISDDTGGTRHETEMINVSFDTTGRVIRGSRAAMTVGVPARLSEDRRSGLLPADTAQAKELVRAIQRCRRH